MICRSLPASKCCSRIVAVVMAMLLIAGCASGTEQDRIYDEAVQQSPHSSPDADDAGTGTGSQNDADGEEDEPVKTLKILSYMYEDYGGGIRTELQFLADRFMFVRPDVRIEFEGLDFTNDIAQLTALTTRLLADPPDIFDTYGFIFEKTKSDTLFFDMNEFLDGPDGIDRGDYFDSILRGAETDGGLFHVPLMVLERSVMLNKRYFDAIGVPVSDIKTLSLTQFLGYQQAASLLFPGDEIGLTHSFNLMDIFRFGLVYDLETGGVNVDTPEMRAYFETVNSIRAGTYVTYTPEEPFWGGDSLSGAVPPSFTRPERNYMYHADSALFAPFAYFTQEHPDMLFSRPVLMVTNTGEAAFGSSSSPAIMRESPNKELAWEFIRFCMEFTDNLYFPDSPVYYSYFCFPVNRARFDNQVRTVLDWSFDNMILTEMLFRSGDAEADAAAKEAAVDDALSRLREMADLLNKEHIYDSAVMLSLIYPDVYLYATGAQDVGRTLASIQSRLELYVAE